MATDEQVLNSVFGAPENGAFSGAIVKERSARVKYWRKPDGWIEMGPDGSTEPFKYQQFLENKHWRPLPDSFGKEVAGTAQSKMRPNKAFPRGKEHLWLKPFFEAGGHTYVISQGDTFAGPGELGQYLMPMAQLVSMGMHRDLEMLRVRPDLKDAVDVTCDYGCIDQASNRPRLFSGCTKAEAQGSHDQHVVAVHKDAVASRAVGDTIAKAMTGMQGQQIDPTLIAAIVSATVAALQGTPGNAAIAAQVVERQEPQVWTLPDPTEDISPPETVEGAIDQYSARAPSVTRSIVDFADKPSRQDIESWSRNDAMSWASRHKDSIPFPEKPLGMKTDDWRKYVLRFLYPEAA